MYIEFCLPSGALAGGYTSQYITKHITEFAREHGFNFRQETVAHRKRIQFNDERAYTILSLVWSAKNPWHRFEIIDGEFPEVYPK